MISQSIPYRFLFGVYGRERPLWIRSEMIRYQVPLDWHSLVIAYHSFDTRQRLAGREASVEDFTDLGEWLAVIPRSRWRFFDAYRIYVYTQNSELNLYFLGAKVLLVTLITTNHTKNKYMPLLFSLLRLIMTSIVWWMPLSLQSQNTSNTRRWLQSIKNWLQELYSTTIFNTPKQIIYSLRVILRS